MNNSRGSGRVSKEHPQEILALHRDRMGRGVRRAIAQHGRGVLWYQPVCLRYPSLEFEMVARTCARACVLLGILTLAIAPQFLPPAAAASFSVPAIDHSEFHARRLALAAELRKELPPGGTGVLVLHGAPEPD